MRGIVIYKNRENGIEQFNKLKEQYERYRIKCIRYFIRKNSSCSMEFENGDYWVLVDSNSGFLGRRVNIAYIERCIDEKTFYSVIMPLLTIGPYTGIQLYGKGDLCIQNRREDE